ncbi:hypothetical protein LTR62_001179 [Meristemomyces frigidus]|uniref:Elongin-A n=1 Tax=Meristemomyces frigidus TaxID=1508187 RepID=A0AAN7TM32_9PEZI|nr:hypothetical protein LTR62_001179 [Meristemomyces frigidus]
MSTGAPTLLSAALRGTMRNISNVTDVADIPYTMILPVLKRIQNPSQLHQIETKSPQIADADAELWKSFIARDVPNWQSKIFEPANPRSWHKVYAKLMRAEKRLQERSVKQLEAAMGGITKAKEAKAITFLDTIIQEPRPAGTRLPAPKNARGRDVVSRLREENRQHARNVRMNMGLPVRGEMQTVRSAREQIRVAPRQMVRDLLAPGKMAPMHMPSDWMPTPKTVLVAPRKDAARQAVQVRVAEEAQLRAKKLVGGRDGGAGMVGARRVDMGRTMEEREARLRALTQRGKVESPDEKGMESMEARDARLRALAQPKLRASPSAPVKPAAVVTPPARSPLTAPTSQKRKLDDTECNTISPPTTSSSDTKSASIAMQRARPCPVPETIKRRPAPSPMLPMKRRKVV